MLVYLWTQWDLLLNRHYECNEGNKESKCVQNKIVSKTTSWWKKKEGERIGNSYA